ncbi:MAG: hypothetical protein WB777_14300 [Mycobacterium sp.]
MPFPLKFDQSFFEGVSVTDAVPWDFDTSLDGYGFMIDWQHVNYLGLREGDYTAATSPVVRQQADTGTEPGEQTLDPSSPWRRASESWVMGGGQTWQDRKESDRTRFHTSKGINPWTLYQLSLLNDTQRVFEAGSSNQYLTLGADKLYWSDGSTLNWTSDGLASTNTAMGSTITALASDGETIYVGLGSSGISYGTTSFTQWVTDAVDLVRFCNGRVIAAAGPNLYNPTGALGTPEGLPAALSVTVPPTFKWVDAVSGSTFIYAAGFAGSQSTIYSIGLKSDASALAAPQIAGTLLPGEIVRALVNYQGFIVACLDQGVRFASADPTSGALTFGDLIPTTSPVLCGTAWDRFVWYGLTNYDLASTGLGRLDPLRFTDQLTPAYASDLMATVQGNVTSCAVFNGTMYFTVSGSGVWAETGNPVEEGTLTSGRITYDLPDIKNALFVDLLHEPLVGEIDVTMVVENTTTIIVGSSTTQETVTSGLLECGQRPGRWFTHTITLKPSNNVSPVLNRVTLQAWPAPHRVHTINVPLQFRESFSQDDNVQTFDCAGAEIFLDTLCEEGRYVPWQYGQGSVQVFLMDSNFIREDMTSDRSGHVGTYVVTLRTL